MTKKDEIEAVVAVAGVQRRDGNVFSAEALRGIAEQRADMRFDEETGRLIYRGPPLPEEAA